jgi:hypothetical protein
VSLTPRKSSRSQPKGRAGGRGGGAGYHLQDLYVAQQLAALLVGDRDPLVEVLWEKKALDLGHGAGAESVHVDDAILRRRSGKCIYIQVKAERPRGGWTARHLVKSSVARQFWQQWASTRLEDRPNTLLRLASPGDLTKLEAVSEVAGRALTPLELLSDEASTATAQEISILASFLSLSTDSPELLAFLKSIQFVSLPSHSHLETLTVQSLFWFGKHAADLADRLARFVSISKHPGSGARSGFSADSLMDALREDGFPEELLIKAKRRWETAFSAPPQADADSPPLQSLDLPVYLPNCPFSLDLGALWGLERRQFLGIVAGSLDRVHASLKRAERLLADSISSHQNESVDQPILRWWIPVHYGDHPDGPSSIAGLYESAESQHSQHVALLRAAGPEAIHVGGRIVVPSFLIHVKAEDVLGRFRSGFLSKGIVGWCESVADTLMPSLPVAIIVVVESSDDVAKELMLALRQNVSEDRRWAFIEQVTPASSLPPGETPVAARMPISSLVPDRCTHSTWLRGQGILRVLSVLRKQANNGSASGHFLAQCVERIRTNPAYRAALEGWHEPFAESPMSSIELSPLNSKTLYALRRDFEEAANDFDSSVEEIAWAATSLLGHSARVALVRELAASEVPSVRLRALLHALADHPDDDAVIDAWIIGTRLTPTLFPERNWFVQQAPKAGHLFLRRMAFAVMRVGASMPFRSQATAILHSYEPLPGDLRTIATLFERSGRALVGKLTPNLFESALRARLDISLDDQELPSPSDHESSRTYWWAFMSRPPTLSCLHRIVTSTDSRHRLVPGLCTDADLHLLKDPLCAEDIASLRRPGCHVGEPV